MPDKSNHSRNEMVSALRDMNDDELQEKLKELQGEMFHEEGLRSVGYAMGKGESNFARYSNLKRDIARAKTELRARELKK